ncbi:MAG TPA: phosphatase PAP2 family protein, partial [Gemmatimonadaceae bacterium]|nr:phosphatase PAP2 family protein [Gemmatimonadaceae bacterium]
PYVDTTGPNPDDWQILRGFHSGTEYRSFPSGHTVAAFAAAAAVSTETSVWWPTATYFAIGPVLYAGAAAVGISRMYNNRHWATDVITGAAIGTFAGTKVVRYHRTHPGNRVDRWLLNASWSPADGGITLSLLPMR